MVSTRRCSVVTSAVVLVIDTIVASARGRNGATSVSGVVAWADIVSRGDKSSSCNGRSANFRVTESLVALVTLPEFHAGALGVAIGRAWTVAFLLLVVAREEESQWNGDQEEEAGGM